MKVWGWRFWWREQAVVSIHPPSSHLFPPCWTLWKGGGGDIRCNFEAESRRLKLTACSQFTKRNEFILETCFQVIHSVFCLTTGPKPPPKRCLHIVRCRASSSSSSFLRLLPRLLATSISPFIFPSITCFRRQFLRKMWPIQLDWSQLLYWTRIILPSYEQLVILSICL